MEIKVIFHIDEAPKWDLLLHNVANLISAYALERPAVCREGSKKELVVSANQADLQLEVLANSMAVQGYMTDAIDADAELMQQLAKQGVRFVACANALAGLQIQPEQLHSFVTVVPAGVRELVERQREGFAYIKP